jgi:6-phosphogluconolactonase
VLDEKTGKLSANTPPAVQMKQGSGPRHIIVSKDNRFAYLLNELTGTVTALALDAQNGTLKEGDSVSFMPADTKLGPGQPRGPVGAGQPERDRGNDIWASDLHLTPDGKFLYAAERTSSSLGGFKVDAASGKLTFVGSTPTEKQPRGFAIDPTGKFMIVSGEKSDTITSYAIDGATGALKEIGKYPTGKGSNWVEIVSFD